MHYRTFSLVGVGFGVNCSVWNACNLPYKNGNVNGGFAFFSLFFAARLFGGGLDGVGKR